MQNFWNVFGRKRSTAILSSPAISFPPDRFSKFPTELRDKIIRNCSSHDQLAFARTCKRMHTEIIPILYSCVDLSLHNEDGLYRGIYIEQVSADNPHRIDYDTQDKCEERQRLFFKAVDLHPHYGSYVARLTWTCFSRWNPEGDERKVTEASMWRTFKMLCNVKFLDFASLACHREQVAPPPHLFPQATHLRLSGQMSFAVVRSIVHSLDPAQLISLECNNLQDFGQLRDGEDLDKSRSLSDFPESEHSSGGDGVRHPGATRGHLRRLEGKCSRLRHLCLRSVGQDDENDRRWSLKLDTARYREWASFIESVRPTIQTLVVEEGLEVEKAYILHYRGSGPLGAPKQVGRPMDTRFSEYLLPVLSSGNWPCLRYMGVYGIGTRPRDFTRGFVAGSVTTSSVRHILSESFAPSNVQVDVRDEASRAFFMRDALTYKNAA